MSAPDGNPPPQYYTGYPQQQQAPPPGYAYSPTGYAQQAQPAYVYPQPAGAAGVGYAQGPVAGGYPQAVYYAPPAAGQVAGYPGQAPQAVYYAPGPGGAVYAPQPGMMAEPPKPHHHKVHGNGAAAPAGAPAPASSAAEAGGQLSYTEQMEKAVRLGFVRKVYAVLAVQLLITFGIVAVFTFVGAVKSFVQRNPAMLWAAIGVSFATIIVLACCGDVSRRYPYNFIFLFIFTLAEAYLVGVLASFYSTDSVLIAIGGTVGLTLALTLFAWQTKIDFTAMGGALLVVLLSFIFFGLFVAIIGGNTLRLVYACIGMCIFGLFLVYDTQLIIGGKHRQYQYGPDDYVLAALNLFLDIIQLFMFILQIFGSRE